MAGPDIDQHPTSRSRAVAYDPPRLRRALGAMPEATLLGANNATGPHGRGAILAAWPRLILESATGADYRVLDDSGRLLDAGPDALVALDGLTRRFGLGGANGPARDADHDPDLPFAGGLIGFLGYDLAPRLERLPRRHGLDSTLPAVRFGLYDTFVLLDHARAEARVWAVDLLGEGDSALGARLDDWLGALDRPPRPLGPIRLGPVRPDQTPDRFRDAVARARAYLAAGDIFQVNLAQRFAASGVVDPLALDARLQALSPAPYSATLLWGDRAVVSASPELFYETRGGSIVTRPIKGTRPRRADPLDDAAQVADLLASPKEAAELAMIVDLERNDLGRVCEFGSVQVVEPRAVETHPTVHHTVATVRGDLRAGLGPIDVVRALFPGGSITGAPKIRAMQIIDELEPCPRGIYTGAIGYWSRDGRSAFNIAIRTIVVAGSDVSYHVGGGIVIDSDPEREYQETLDKGRALRIALEGPTGEDSA